MAALTAPDPDDEATVLRTELERREREHERALREVVQRMRAPEPLPPEAGGPYRLLLEVERARAALEAETAALQEAARAHEQAREEAEAEAARLRERVLELGDELAVTAGRLGEYADWAHQLRDEREAGAQRRAVRLARRLSGAVRARVRR